MRTIMVMFDSLNRHMLPPYAPDTWVHAPNFARLAQRTATFDRSYVCSMPCMPARRDFHTGRPNFLHTGWGGLEPFDDSVPQMLQDAGVYTHLVSDHYHYWEDGGATFHGRYNTWQFIRGQEGDPYVGQVAEPRKPNHMNPRERREDWVNREHQQRLQDLPQNQTFDAGLAFIERNHDQDNWFLQLETFDPHEPFVSHRSFKDRYPSDYDGALFDWPAYREVTETPEQVAEARRNYAALLSMCDARLGDILDMMDRHDMWQDTMLIVWTDHGYMLGEHNCWAKNWMPMYEEVAHTPFFMWDPRQPDAAGTRRDALVQPAIDLGPTLLRSFGLEPTADMLGHDLAPVMADDTAVRDAAIFGYHNQHVNITDGRYVYMRQGRADVPCPSYTLMPMSMRGFKMNPSTDVSLAEPFSFTKGMPVLKFMRKRPEREPHPDLTTHLLYDLKTDPGQSSTAADGEAEQRLKRRMAELMHACDAPPAQYVRMALEPEAEAAGIAVDADAASTR